jgi:hypothetical protein
MRCWLARTAIVAGGIISAGVNIGYAQAPAYSTSGAQTAPTASSSQDAPGKDTDYTTRPVAFIDHDTVITREELGEFLIQRRGADKADFFVDRRIVDIACSEAGITVSAGEVENSLNDDLKGFGGITRGDFVKQILQRYGKNLSEWKEDVIRPKLMMTKLCRGRIHVSEEDVQAAFEARYGEKIECRIIQWPTQEKAEAAYPKIRDNEQEFNEQAKHQEIGPLASSGGKIKPINHHLDIFNPAFKDKVVNDRIEKEAFRLQPGEVSNLLKIPNGGYLVIKCDRRIAADTSVNPTAVHEELLKEMTERKTLEQIPKLLSELRAKAQPEKSPDAQAENAHKPFTPGMSRGRVIARIYGSIPVTREEFGEFLITRYGAEMLELLVNKRIIEEACKAKNITVGRDEIQIALMEKIATVGNRERFDQLLHENRTSPPLYEEDVLRPQLELTKLCEGRVKVTDEDLKIAYEAYHGEKIECRLIIWPRDQRKHAMAAYADLRDSEKAFAEKAATQDSPRLAHTGGRLMENGKVRLVGRHTLGNAELERELFSLQPGEVSRLVETPEGIVVMKCDKRYPAEPMASLESEKSKLIKEVKERKVQAEIPNMFAELRKKADPRFLIKDPEKAIDIKSEVTRDLNNDIAPRRANGRAPAGN